LIGGDLSELSEVDRLAYYKATCESLGLNPLTKPFDYIQLNDRLTLYAKRDCTDQLRNSRNVSVKIVSREVIDGVFVVTAQAKMPDGREDESVGAVPLVKEGGQWRTSQGGKRFFEPSGEMTALRPDDRANAMMKAETKAKRRVTLSICGLGVLDESEFDTIGELKNARGIDTGGHQAGTQAAADHVAQEKIRKTAEEVKPSATFLFAGQEIDVPTPLVSIFRILSGPKGLESVKGACQLLEKEIVCKCGADGGAYYERLTNDFRAEHPKIGAADMPAVKELIYKLWLEANKEAVHA